MKRKDSKESSLSKRMGEMVGNVYWELQQEPRKVKNLLASFRADLSSRKVKPLSLEDETLILQIFENLAKGRDSWEQGWKAFLREKSKVHKLYRITDKFEELSSVLRKYLAFEPFTVVLVFSNLKYFARPLQNLKDFVKLYKLDSPVYEYFFAKLYVHLAHLHKSTARKQSARSDSPASENESAGRAHSSRRSSQEHDPQNYNHNLRKKSVSAARKPKASRSPENEKRKTSESAV